MSVPRDIREFLDGYPGIEDDKSLVANLEFYSNKRRCLPDNMLIDEIHEAWFGDYAKLEYKHGYIQWLFPIREFGMNYESQPLQVHEIHSMKKDPLIMERLVRSYRLMLDFYGMELEHTNTGVLKRSANYQSRYTNLIRSPHNYLRISRILKCLSEFGLEYLNSGFLLHVLNEQSEFGMLRAPGLQNSMDRWWANCLRDDGERGWIRNHIAKVRSGDGFVFTRDMYVDVLQIGRRGTDTVSD